MGPIGGTRGEAMLHGIDVDVIEVRLEVVLVAQVATQECLDVDSISPNH